MENMSKIWYVGDWKPERYNSYNNYMKTFETKLKHQYPLGEDSFSIDHGTNYFTFFRRLGEPFFYAIIDKGNVVGTICYVYRKIYGRKIMYICDLKFDPQIRNKGMMSTLLQRTIPTCLTRTRSFYAVSMNDDTSSIDEITSSTNENTNKILSMGQHLGTKYNINIKSGGILNLYSLDYDKMTFVHNIVGLRKSESCSLDSNTFRYISLGGIKDLIVKKKDCNNNNDNKPLQLLHLCYIDADNIHDNIKRINKNMFKSEYPVKGFTHMFCTPAGSILSNDLEQFNIHPDSTATIIQYGMNDFNWEIIQTCDI